MRTFLSALVMTLIAAATVSAGPVNLVTNGGFETGDFSGWTQSGDTRWDSVDPYGLSSSYSASFGAVGSVSYITQDLSTVSGATYNLSFWVVGSGAPGIVSVDWGGVNQIYLNDPSFDGWTRFAVTGMVANGTSTALTFGFQNDPSFYNLDDVSVTTPEPATFGIAGIVLLGLGLLRRKAR